LSLYIFVHSVIDALANLVAHLKEVENNQLLVCRSNAICQHDLRDPQLILPQLQ